MLMKRRYPIAPTNRCRPGRHFTIYPDPDRLHFTVEVHIAHNVRRMREAMVHAGFHHLTPVDNSVAGQVINRTHNPRGRLYNGHVVAHMVLNIADLHARPAETVAHECGHAAMAWARYCKADLTKMGGTVVWKRRKQEGEELLCYAIGDLAKQVNRICHVLRIWG